jgi:hypothetical protein
MASTVSGNDCERNGAAAKRQIAAMAMQNFADLFTVPAPILLDRVLRQSESYGNSEIKFKSKIKG